MREERAENNRHRNNRAFTGWRPQSHSHNQYVRAATVETPVDSVVQCDDGLKYHDWFVTLLQDNFGRAVADAVYDPDLFNTMVTSLVHTGGTAYKWRELDDLSDPRDLSEMPTKPETFDTPAKMLWWAKRLTTAGLSKISRDVELQRLFIRLCTDPERKLKMKFLEKPTLQAMSAQIQYFHTVLQLMIDTNLTPETKLAYSALVKGHRGMDVLVLVSGWLNHTASSQDIHQLLESPDALAGVVNQRLQDLLRSTDEKKKVKPSQSIFPLNYEDKTYFESLQSNSKFWSMLRPTAGCSSTTRICEIAEGCRYVCNPEYLLHAGRRAASSSTEEVQKQPQPYQHRIIGMGSNNEYNWELSLLSLFGVSATTSSSSNISTTEEDEKRTTHVNDDASSTNRIGWLSAFDCANTVAAGDRQWNVPKLLQEATVGFAAASVCGGGSRKEASDYLAAKAMKALQLKFETTWGQEFIGQSVMRFKAHPQAIASAKQRLASGKDVDTIDKFTMSQKRSTSGKDLISPLWFDALTILKIDTAGAEWKFIPAWIRGELHGVGAHSPARAVEKGSTDVIDFAASASDFFTVSLFSLQFHRLGSSEDAHGYSAAGALRAHLLSLQVQGLGFIMVAHESDERGNCCYENTYVHVRHFIKSEVWMALRDDL